MTSEVFRIVVAAGLLMMVFLLRLQAERFGAAEYDEKVNRFHRGFWTRLSWYALGLGLVAGIYVVHPQPHDVLLLVVGRKVDLISYGMPLAAVGVLQAAAFAWYRYGGLRLPEASAYPGAVLNAVATAVIDEAVFRGVILGILYIAIRLPSGSAIIISALLYVLVTRLAAPGHHRYTVFLSLAMGLAFGWATLTTGGIGAAILAHSVTSFAMFVCTGHAGQVLARGKEPEEIEIMSRPRGWQDVRTIDRSRGPAGPADTDGLNRTN
jgi:membrane protease YdiL (CAAX protease family)